MSGTIRATIVIAAFVATPTLAGCSGDTSDSPASTEPVAQSATSVPGASPERDLTASHIQAMDCADLGALSDAEADTLDASERWTVDQVDALALSDAGSWSAAAEAGCAADPNADVARAVALALDPFVVKRERVDRDEFGIRMEHAFASSGDLDESTRSLAPFTSSYDNTSFLIPGYGSVTADAGAIFAGRDILDLRYVSADIPSSALIAVAVEDVLGEGLDAGYQQLVMASYDANGGEWTTVEVAGDSARASLLSIYDASAASGEVIAVGLSSDNGHTKYTVAVNVADASVTATYDASLYAASQGTVVLRSWDGDCATLRSIDWVDRSEQWSVDGGDYGNTYGRHCAVVQVVGGTHGTALPKVPSFDAFYRVRLDGVDESPVFDAASGERFAALTARASYYDPIGRIALIEPYRRVVPGPKEGDPITIIDAVSGETLWNMEADAYGRLDVDVVALWDGVLYVETVNGNVAVDIATGDDSATWSRYPSAQMGRWTLWSDGALVRDPST